jgi:hypothetical protein
MNMSVCIRAGYVYVCTKKLWNPNYYFVVCIWLAPAPVPMSENNYPVLITTWKHVAPTPLSAIRVGRRRCFNSSVTGLPNGYT